MQSMTLVMGQINPVVGDVKGNTAKILAAATEAKRKFNASLIVFPELTLTGYPPEDLLLRPGLLKRVDAAIVLLSEKLTDIAVIVGHPQSYADGNLYNAASLIQPSKSTTTYFKQHLPNYGVFDEKRYFKEGTEPTVVDLGGIKFGLTICEDIWFKQPVELAKQAGAEIILNLNASPYQIEKPHRRITELKKRIHESGLPIVYVNQVGGQDELVFDGASFSLNNNGNIVLQADAFKEGLYPLSLQRDKSSGKLKLSGDIVSPEERLSLIYKALVMGLKDYVRKNNFPGVLIGLSGGIDSALTLALAVDALGPNNVEAVMMPSRFTSQISLADAAEMANGLGVKYSVISIEPVFNSFLESLSEAFSGMETDTTEENIQARCRGTILMALSNKTGAMVLATGNKSEVAVGYSTLYGDMAGGFSPLKDVYKTLVYELSNYRNLTTAIIPQRIIDRPPSAELADNQLDQDSLPDYAILDKILQRYIADERCFEDLVLEGFDGEVVARVIRMVDKNEYKRRQAAPGIHISDRAFGRDRRYPITSAYNVTSTIE